MRQKQAAAKKSAQAHIAKPIRAGQQVSSQPVSIRGGGGPAIGGALLGMGRMAALGSNVPSSTSTPSTPSSPNGATVGIVTPVIRGNRSSEPVVAYSKRIRNAVSTESLNRHLPQGNPAVNGSISLEDRRRSSASHSALLANSGGHDIMSMRQSASVDRLNMVCLGESGSGRRLPTMPDGGSRSVKLSGREGEIVALKKAGRRSTSSQNLANSTEHVDSPWEVRKTVS